MAISAEFNTELALVDGAKSFTYDSAYSDYGENEWSVDGWTVRGGSEEACEHGASEAMYQMGYRWYTPEISIRPASLPSGGVTLARQEFVFPYFRLYTNYGFALWASPKGAGFQKWVTLNAADDTRIPHGHAWPAIIQAIEADDGFFTANPTYYTGTIGTAGESFNLALTGGDYTALVNRVASYVAGTLNSYNRRNFDPQDGSSWTPDQVFGFANDVVAKVQETVPDAELDLYAYAGHRRAPSFNCPSLNIQVALGFNDAGIGYSALVQEWGPKAKRVDLRGYGLIAAGDEYDPFGGGICEDTAFENQTFSYSDYVAAGCKGLSMESSAHNIPALVGHYTLIRFMKDGVTSHSDTRADMLANLPDFTQEVHDLYEYWGITGKKIQSIEHTYSLIDALPDNSLTTQIKRYWIWYRHIEDVIGEYRRKNGSDGGYYTLRELSLRWARKLQDDGTIHGYTYARQEAGIKEFNATRPYLMFGENPHWVKYGEYPPLSLYDELKANYAASQQRPDVLEDTTLALCDVTPYWSSTGTAASFFCSARTQFAYIGPGTVTDNYGTEAYGSGIHFIEKGGVVSSSGGLLFLNSHPQFSIPDLNHGGMHWIYVPQMTRGRLRLSSTIRVVVYYGATNTYRQEIRKDLYPDPVDGDPKLLPAGQLNMRWSMSRGVIYNINANPWISPVYNRALMPKALAVREGLTILSEYEE